MVKKIEISPELKECLKRNMRTAPLDGTNGSRKSLGHMKLTFAVKRMMRIVRLPTHPERFSYENCSHYKAVSEALEKITEDEWIFLVNEVEKVYSHTQVELKKDYPNEKILLQRRIKLFKDGGLDKNHYGTYMHYAIEAAKLNGSVEIDVDILTGWCTADPGNYGDILIKHEFPIEDVIMGTQLLEKDSGLESDEWLVVNRSPSGLLTFNVNDIKLPKKLEENIGLNSREAALKNIFGGRWNGQRLYINERLHGYHPDDWAPWYVRISHRVADWISKKK